MQVMHHVQWSSLVWTALAMHPTACLAMFERDTNHRSAFNSQAYTCKWQQTCESLQATPCHVAQPPNKLLVKFQLGVPARQAPS